MNYAQSMRHLHELGFEDLYVHEPAKADPLLKLKRLIGIDQSSKNGSEFMASYIEKYKTNETNDELRQTGLSNFDLIRHESRNISKFLHKDEHIMAAIYGKSVGGRQGGLMVATNLRIVYLHQIPLFTTMDEISYELVSGITNNKTASWWSSVILHTRNGDYQMNFVNLKAAEKFSNFIEKRSIDRPYVTNYKFQKEVAM